MDARTVIRLPMQPRAYEMICNPFVFDRPRDPKGTERLQVACRGGASGRTSPHTLVRSDAPPRSVFVPYNDRYL